MFQKKAHFILSGWNTPCKSLSGSCNKSTYISCLLAEKREEECVSERWGRPFHHFICRIATNTCSLPKSFPEIQYWRAQLSQRDREFVATGYSTKNLLFFGDQVMITRRKNPFLLWENGLFPVAAQEHQERLMCLVIPLWTPSELCATVQFEFHHSDLL